jgi:hypothetical protein
VVRPDRRTRSRLLFLHLDILVWLPNLRHLEQAHLFIACLLLVRVADQVGYGFRRAIYSTTSCWPLTRLLVLGLAISAGEALWADRLTIAATMYLLGIYPRVHRPGLRAAARPVRQAMQAARELVDSLEQKKVALETQARDLEEAAAAPSRRTSPRRSSWRPSATRSARP